MLPSSKDPYILFGAVKRILPNLALHRIEGILLHSKQWKEKTIAMKPWLRDYFKRLAENLEKGEITDERALSATVEIPLPGWGKGKSLLPALEYDKENVRSQYPIRVGTSKPRVDFMLGKDPNRWMLDLKKPHNINRPKHVEQMQSYLSQEKVSLGILFNGNWAIAYVNPEHPFVAHICQTITEQELSAMPELDLKRNPVKKAQLNSANIQEMTKFFRLLRHDKTLLDIQSIVSKLTEDYVSKLKGELKISTRIDKIQKALFETIQNPNEQIISSLIKASSALSHLKAKPSEVLNV